MINLQRDGSEKWVAVNMGAMGQGDGDKAKTNLDGQMATSTQGAGSLAWAQSLLLCGDDGCVPWELLTNHPTVITGGWKMS